MVDAWIWAVFGAGVIALLVADLALVSRVGIDVTRLRTAAWFSAGWVVLGLAFGLAILVWRGGEAAAEYYTGYLIEKSLSVDNVFVFALIFGYFSVPDEYQHRVLFWGVFGAFLMRLGLILVGVELLEMFEWAVYVFGGLLIVTGVRLAFREPEEDVEPERNPLLRLVRRAVPLTQRYHGHHFFVRARDIDDDEELRHARRTLLGRVATPLLPVLVVIETTDLLFAVDSIPAVLGVTRDQFIVFSSNAFALLGLRALYFVVAGAVRSFEYLHYGLAVVLAFIGVKFVLEGLGIEIGIAIALSVVAGVVAISIVASLLHRDDRTAASEP